MPEMDKSTSFTLSYAHHDKEERFTSAAAAGRAFADADASQQPHVVEATDKGARTVAHTVTIGTDIQKSVPTLDSVRKDITDLNRDGVAPSQGMKAGKQTPVQKLANVTKEQEAQVHGATAKEARPVPERQMSDQTKGERSR